MPTEFPPSVLTPLEEQCCDNCLSFRHGECHRHAPRPELASQEWAWASVEPGMWCREWEPLPVGNVAKGGGR